MPVRFRLAESHWLATMATSEHDAVSKVRRFPFFFLNRLSRPIRHRHPYRKQWFAAGGSSTTKVACLALLPSYHSYRQAQRQFSRSEAQFPVDEAILQSVVGSLKFGWDPEAE